MDNEQAETVKQQLTEQHGKLWSTEDLRAEFDVIGFAAPYVVVTRKSDGVKGSMQFTHNPRFYFSFVAD